MSDDLTQPTMFTTEFPSPIDESALREAVTAYNSAWHPFEKCRPVGCFVRASDGALLAGASGYTWWGWLAVEYLWVAEDQRGAGLGARVIHAVEQEARARGCHAVWLDTFSFQAKPFYEGQGYRQFGELADFPADASRHFMWKPL